MYVALFFLHSLNGLRLASLANYVWALSDNQQPCFRFGQVPITAASTYVVGQGPINAGLCIMSGRGPIIFMPGF